MAGKIIEQSIGNVHDVGESEVGKLLDNVRFRDELERVIAREEFGVSGLLSFDPDGTGSTASVPVTLIAMPLS
jgi:hypothetical protein